MTTTPNNANTGIIEQLPNLKSSTNDNEIPTTPKRSEPTMMVTTPIHSTTTNSNQRQTIHNKTKRSRRRGGKPGKKPRRWTPKEQETFLRGLELYGREWSMISKMDGINDRDVPSIRSHAQTYFIKLWYNNTPLPLKVQESGNGYSLSGKPLDVNGGAVSAFLKGKTGGVIPSHVKIQRASAPATTSSNTSASINVSPSKYSIRTRRRRKIKRKADEKWTDLFEDLVCEHPELNTKNEQKLQKIFSTKNVPTKRPNIFKGDCVHIRGTKDGSRRSVGVSYALPMEIEGFRPNDGAMKHLAPLFIRPPSMRQKARLIGNAQFEHWFKRIWFDKFSKLQSFVDEHKSLESPFKLPHSLQSSVDSKRKRSDKEEMDLDDEDDERTNTDTTRQSIVYSSTDLKTDFCTIWDSKYLPEMHHQLAMPDIDQNLVQNRKFHVVYFDVTNKATIPVNRITKKWAMMNKDVRKEIFKEYEGEYLVVEDMEEMFERAEGCSNYKQCIFLVHFRYNPFIGVQTFCGDESDEAFDAVLASANIVLMCRFINAANYLSKEDKKRNKEIKRLRRSGKPMMERVYYYDDDEKETKRGRKRKRMEISSGSDDSEEEEVNRPLKRRRVNGYECNICKEEFVTSQFLREHNKRQHHLTYFHRDSGKSLKELSCDVVVGSILQNLINSAVKCNDDQRAMEVEVIDKKQLVTNVLQSMIDSIVSKQMAQKTLKSLSCEVDMNEIMNFEKNQSQKKTCSNDIDSDEFVLIRSKATNNMKPYFVKKRRKKHKLNGNKASKERNFTKNGKVNEHKCPISECPKAYATSGNVTRHLRDFHKLDKKLRPLNAIKIDDNSIDSGDTPTSDNNVLMIKTEQMSDSNKESIDLTDFETPIGDSSKECYDLTQFGKELTPTQTQAYKAKINNAIDVLLPKLSIAKDREIKKEAINPIINLELDNTNALIDHIIKQGQTVNQLRTFLPLIKSEYASNHQCHPFVIQNEQVNPNPFLFQNPNLSNVQIQDQSIPFFARQATGTDHLDPWKNTWDTKDWDAYVAVAMANQYTNYEPDHSPPKKKRQKKPKKRKRKRKYREVEAEEKPSKRLNVRLELICDHNVFEETSHFEHCLLNSISEYFYDHIQSVLDKVSDPLCPFYFIHTRDTFRVQLAIHSEQRSAANRNFTKLTYYKQQSLDLCKSFLNFSIHNDSNVYARNLRKKSKYRNAKSITICADENVSDLDESSDGDNDMNAMNGANEQKAKNIFDERMIHYDEKTNSNDAKEEEKKESTENKADDTNEEEKKETVENEIFKAQSDWMCRDRFMNGAKCAWIGATAYPDIFSEDEICAIERCLDRLQTKSNEGKHKNYTAQNTLGRRGCLIRTKHFFGARYLWHHTEEADLSQTERSRGAGLRVDVDAVPDELYRLCEAPLVERGVIAKDFIEGIAFNMYHDGSEGIGPHFDDIGRFDRPIISIRLFSDARIAFGCDLYGTSNGLFSIPLSRGTVLKLERNSFAADGIKHNIRPCDMYGKSAAIIMRKFNRAMLNEAYELQKEREQNGYYDNFKNSEKTNGKEKEIKKEKVSYGRGVAIDSTQSSAGSSSESHPSKKEGGKKEVVLKKERTQRPAKRRRRGGFMNENEYDVGDGFLVADDEFEYVENISDQEDEFMFANDELDFVDLEFQRDLLKIGQTRKRRKIAKLKTNF